jgi:ribosomal protein L37E
VDAGRVKIDIPETSVTLRDAGVVDLGREREIRSLRERLRVADEKIADLSTALTPAAVVKRTSDHGFKCGIHPQVIVDDELDRVTCSVCGEELPAIDVLRAIANEEMNFCRWNETLRRQQHELSREVETLKAKRASLASDVRKRQGVRKCRACGNEYDRALTQCTVCGLPASGSRATRPRRA